MERNGSRAAFVLALLLASAITASAQRDYRDQSLDLLRFLATKPWGARGHNRWDRAPRFDMDIADRYGTKERWIKPRVLQRTLADTENDIDNGLEMDTSMGLAGEDFAVDTTKNWAGPMKRSAVATALNGRRRRQPTQALDVLNDVGSFFDSLRDNLENLASLSPQQRATLFAEPPTVVQAPSTGGGGGGGGSGARRLHALRPLRPTGNIRTYNRRSFMEADGVYPGANHHDPGLLWTGLGR